MKTIVTHTSPDFDAITSAWLIQKFLPGWEEAKVVFVPAGTTLHDKAPDTNPDIIHVDTGFGQFDHHQTNARTSAAEIVYKYLEKNGYLDDKAEKALERIVQLVVDDDHFKDPYFPDPTSDRYLLLPFSLVNGLKASLGDDTHVYTIGTIILEAALRVFQNVIKAEIEIEKGFVFTSYLGKSIAMETTNEETMKLALKSGFSLVVRKDPIKGNVRIKTLPDPKLDLTPVAKKIEKEDKVGTWFLHASKHMLLNGTSKKPGMKPSPLTLQQLIEIIRSI